MLILPPNALDRCTDENDWVRQELAFALKSNINIIPIMMRGFEFPKNLPEDINKVRNMEGVTASSDYFDAVIKRITELLDTTKERRITDSKISGKNIISGTICLFLCIICSIISIILWHSQDLPKEVIFDRAFEMGKFIGIYGLACSLWYLSIKKFRKLKYSSKIINALIREPVAFYYVFVLIVGLFLKNNCVILPSLYDFLSLFFINKSISNIVCIIIVFAFTTSYIIGLMYNLNAFIYINTATILLYVFAILYNRSINSLNLYSFFEMLSAIWFHIFFHISTWKRKINVPSC